MNNSLVVTNVIKKVKQGGGKEITGGRNGDNAYRVKGSPAPFMVTSDWEMASPLYSFSCLLQYQVLQLPTPDLLI